MKKLIKTAITLTAIGVAVKVVSKRKNLGSFLEVEPGKTTIRNKKVVMK